MTQGLLFDYATFVSTFLWGMLSKSVRQDGIWNTQFCILSALYILLTTPWTQHYLQNNKQSGFSSGFCWFSWCRCIRLVSRWSNLFLQFEVSHPLKFPGSFKLYREEVGSFIRKIGEIKEEVGIITLKMVPLQLGNSTLLKEPSAFHSLQHTV